MKHLTLEEMTAFMSARSLDGESVELAKRVNGHICRCKECRDKLRAFQTVFDGFYDIASSDGERIADPKDSSENVLSAKDGDENILKKPLTRKK